MRRAQQHVAGVGHQHDALVRCVGEQQAIARGVHGCIHVRVHLAPHGQHRAAHSRDPAGRIRQIVALHVAGARRSHVGPRRQHIRLRTWFAEQRVVAGPFGRQAAFDLVGRHALGLQPLARVVGALVTPVHRAADDDGEGGLRAADDDGQHPARLRVAQEADLGGIHAGFGAHAQVGGHGLGGAVLHGLVQPVAGAAATPGLSQVNTPMP